MIFLEMHVAESIPIAAYVVACRQSLSMFQERSYV